MLHTPPCRFALQALLAILLSALSACASDGDDGAPGSDVPDLLYATISKRAEVWAVQAGSGEVRERYPVGMGPAIILATPDGQKLYTANWADHTVSAIDLGSGEVATVDFPGQPFVIAMAPSGQRLFVGVDGGGIDVIDTATDSVVDNFPTDMLAASLIVSPDSKTLYVATFEVGLTFAPGQLRAISAETGEEVHAPIDVGIVPAWITIGRDGSRVYTLNFLSDDISVVDTESFEVVDTIATGSGSQAIIANVTPDGSRLYVTNYGSEELIGIDTATHEIVQTIPLGGKPVGVEVSPDGERVYVTHFGAESLGAPLTDGLNYLLTGMYAGTGDGGLSGFDVETGEPVIDDVVTDPGPTSLVVMQPAAP